MKKIYTLIFLLVSLVTFSQEEVDKRCVFDAYGVFVGEEVTGMDYKTGNFYMNENTGVLHINIEDFMKTLELKATDVYVYPSYIKIDTTSGIKVVYSDLLKVLFIEIGYGTRIILTDTSIEDPEVLPFGKEELKEQLCY